MNYIFTCIQIDNSKGSIHFQAAPYGSYESARWGSCFRGTRAGLLSGVCNWMDTRGQLIYILYGIAGIGGSTIAKMMTERAARDKILSASSFLSRDKDNRKLAKLLFPTPAYQLSYYYLALPERVNAAVEEDPEPTGRDPLRQPHRAPLQTPLDEAKYTPLAIRRAR